MITAFEVRSALRKRSARPVRDANYRRYVRSHPCAACGRTWSVEACHTGPHGLSQKSCDLTCIPLCRQDHRDFDADPRGFAEKRNLDVSSLIAELQAGYESRKAA